MTIRPCGCDRLDCMYCRRFVTGHGLDCNCSVDGRGSACGQFDTERELGYTQGESGVVCPDTSESVTPPRAGSATRPDFRHQLEPHPLRCVCEPCLAERDQIRDDAYVEMTATLPKRTWARRSWNGPLARFPGTESDDAGRMRLRRRPR